MCIDNQDSLWNSARIHTDMEQCLFTWVSLKVDLLHLIHSVQWQFQQRFWMRNLMKMPHLGTLSQDQPNLTKLFGLKERSWSNVLVWILGLILFTTVAIREIYPLLDEYNNNNVATRIAFVAGNNSLKPPLMTLCLDFPYQNYSSVATIARYLLSNKTIKCQECDDLSNQSWNVWDGREWGTENLRSLEIKLFDVFIGKVLNGSIDVLNTSNSRWNRPIVESAWYFLAYLAYYETRISLSEEDTSYILSDMEVYDLNSLLANTGMDRLYQTLMDVFCQHIFVEEYPYGSGKRQCLHHLSAKKASMFTKHACFALPQIERGFSLSILAKTRNVSWPLLNNTQSKVRLFLGSAAISWPRAFEHIQPLYISDLGPPGQDPLEETVLLRYYVAMSVREKRPYQDCYMDDSPASCIGNCMMDQIGRACGCVLFSFRFAEKTGPPYCNGSYYTQCKINKTIELDTCETQCTQPCQYVSYQWHTSHEVKSDSPFRAFFLDVIPLAFPFVEFGVTVRDTPEQFISRTGSILNLFLGISGITFITLAAYLVNLIAHCLDPKMKTVDTHNRLGKRKIAIADIGRATTFTYGDEMSKETVKLEMETMRQELKEAKQAIADLKTKMGWAILPVALNPLGCQHKKCKKRIGFTRCKNATVT